MTANKTVIIVPIIAIVIIVIAVTSFAVPPDFDQIIANRDCDKAMSLTESQIESANAGQQIKLALLWTSCSLGG